MDYNIKIRADWNNRYGIYSDCQVQRKSSNFWTMFSIHYNKVK